MASNVNQLWRDMSQNKTVTKQRDMGIKNPEFSYNVTSRDMGVTLRDVT